MSHELNGNKKGKLLAENPSPKEEKKINKDDGIDVDRSDKSVLLYVISSRYYGCQRQATVIC